MLVCTVENQDATQKNYGALTVISRKNILLKTMIQRPDVHHTEQRNQTVYTGKTTGL